MHHSKYSRTWEFWKSATRIYGSQDLPATVGITILVNAHTVTDANYVWGPIRNFHRFEVMENGNIKEKTQGELLAVSWLWP